MENASEALKLAFAVFVFGMALTIAIGMSTLAKQTSDIVLRVSDVTTNYDYQDYEKNTNADEHRIVGIDTVMSTVYRYKKENYKVIFKTATYDVATGKFTSDFKNLTIYNSLSKKEYWITNQYTGTEAINAFDINEEIARREAWCGSDAAIKANLDAVFSGTGNYTSCPLRIPNATKKKFVELIGRQQIDSQQTDDQIEVGNNASNVTTTKTIITYVLIN